MRHMWPASVFRATSVIRSFLSRSVVATEMSQLASRDGDSTHQSAEHWRSKEESVALGPPPPSGSRGRVAWTLIA
eukprot:950962-Prymnesium_polylepis.1